MSLAEAVSKLSIHGTQYLGDKSWFSKLFWFIVIVSGFTLFIVLSLEIGKEFESKNTKLDLESGHSSLDDVVFPSIVLCNLNHYRLSFFLWLHDLLIKEGVMDEPLWNGTWRKFDKKDNQFWRMLLKSFFSGGEESLTEFERKILKTILGIEEFQNYFKVFAEYVSQEKLKTSKLYDNTTLIFAEDIMDDGYDYKDKDLIRSFMVELSSQWKLDNVFLSIKWYGSMIDQKLVKYDPVLATSQGVCSWLAPLPREQKNEILSWPLGVLPGENNGLELILDTESYDYAGDDDVIEGVGYKMAVIHPLDMPIMQQSGKSFLYQ